MSSKDNLMAVADSSNAVAMFWAQCLEQSDRQVQIMLGVWQAVGDPQQMQRRWLDAVAQCLESFMRSPEFLEIMKRHLKVMTKLKELQNQLLQGTARQFGVPLADDISGLFERLNSTERTIVKRLQAIEHRLGDVEAKFGNAPDQHHLS